MAATTKKPAKKPPKRKPRRPPRRPSFLDEMVRKETG
jgi:hypothetical protein